MANKRKSAPKKRNVKQIILHCSATREGVNIGVNTIRRWHMSPPRNWSDIGYHYVIALDGRIQVGRPEERSGAHTKGQNDDSIGICYIGGVDQDGKTPKDTVTAAQQFSLLQLIGTLRKSYGAIPVYGHNKYANKACPSFDVQEKYPSINKGVKK